MVLLLAIEGNIGIGKSTLLANLKAHFAGDKRVAFVDEARQT
jgi:deoxyadenosine/deoxycytidine kinase